MKYLVGRFEESAKLHYSECKENENTYYDLGMRRMSELTQNLLKGINYKQICFTREQNFLYLERTLGIYNKLDLIVPKGAFMYPMYVSNGAEIRKKLKEVNIYIPILWPNVFDICNEAEVEYDLAENILPLPCDQRYNIEEMDFVAKSVLKFISK